MADRVLAVRGPRSLLRQIREAMAGGGPAQAKLDMVVRIIAQLDGGRGLLPLSAPRIRRP